GAPGAHPAVTCVSTAGGSRVGAIRARRSHTGRGHLTGPGRRAGGEQNARQPLTLRGSYVLPRARGEAGGGSSNAAGFRRRLRGLPSIDACRTVVGTNGKRSRDLRS